MKTCPSCKETKSFELFGKDKRRKGGQKYLCRSCHNAANKKLRESNPEGYRKTNLAYARSPRGKEIQRSNSLRRKYWPHLTNEQAVSEYDRMLASQKNSCALCGIHQSIIKRSFDVDHCHTSKKVRGLLCHRCNYTVLKDFTYEQAAKLAAYLKP